MKNSTKRSSYKLGGLLFVPKKAPAYKVYKGVQGWLNAGRPSPAYILDNHINLDRARIPIVDCVLQGGVATRTKVGKPRTVEKVRTKFIPPMSVAEATSDVIPGVKASETKDHHKMSY